jgi:hypothetical protein
MTKTCMRAAVAAACVIAVTFGAGGAVSAERGNSTERGNSANAKACRDGGYADWTRGDSTSFADEGACVSYAARGGVLIEAVEPPPAKTFQEVCEGADLSYSVGIAEDCFGVVVVPSVEDPEIIASLTAACGGFVANASSALDSDSWLISVFCFPD